MIEKTKQVIKTNFSVGLSAHVNDKPSQTRLLKTEANQLRGMSYNIINIHDRRHALNNLWTEAADRKQIRNNVTEHLPFLTSETIHLFKCSREEGTKRMRLIQSSSLEVKSLGVDRVHSQSHSRTHCKLKHITDWYLQFKVNLHTQFSLFYRVREAHGKEYMHF